MPSNRRRPTGEGREAVFRHALQPQSEFERVSQDPNSIGRAFQEVTEQCLAVLNIVYDPRAVQRIVSGNAGDVVMVVLNVPPVKLGSDLIVVKFSGNYNDNLKHRHQGLRKKQTARTNPAEFLFPAFFEGSIVVECAHSQPTQGLFKMYGPYPDDRKIGTVQYLMRCFKARGLVCTESIVREAIHMTEHGGRVQMLLADDWIRQLAFPTQNKNLLLDLVEDTVLTLLILVRAKFSPPKMAIVCASDEWPHTSPSSPLSIRSQNWDAHASLDRDVAGHNILNLSLNFGSGRCNLSALRASVNPLGGINLKFRAAPIRNGDADDEGNAGASGDARDAGEQNGRGGEDCDEDEGRSGSDVEGSSGHDSYLQPNSGHDDGEEQDPDGFDHGSGGTMVT